MQNDQSFEEVAVQDCSEEEVDDEVNEDPDENLFSNLQKISEEDEKNVRMHHESVIVKLDGTIMEKE
jgi:hypothetical protein